MQRPLCMVPMIVGVLLVSIAPLQAAKPRSALVRKPQIRTRKATAGRTASRPATRSKVPVKETIEKAALDIPELKTVANVDAVTAALQRLPGVQSAVVDLKIHLAVVDYCPSKTGLAQFLTACREAGFEAEEYRVESRFPKPIKLKGG